MPLPDWHVKVVGKSLQVDKLPSDPFTGAADSSVSTTAGAGAGGSSSLIGGCLATAEAASLMDDLDVDEDMVESSCC